MTWWLRWWVVTKSKQMMTLFDKNRNFFCLLLCSEEKKKPCFSCLPTQKLLSNSFCLWKEVLVWKQKTVVVLKQVWQKPTSKKEQKTKKKQIKKTSSVDVFFLFQQKCKTKKQSKECFLRVNKTIMFGRNKKKSCHFKVSVKKKPFVLEKDVSESSPFCLFRFTRFVFFVFFLPGGMFFFVANVKQNFKCFLFCYLTNANTKKKFRCFFVLYNKLE